MAEQPESEISGGARSADDYEAKYMAGDGALYRDKIKVPGKFLLLFALPIVIQAVALGTVLATAPTVPLTAFIALPITAFVMTLLALLFSVLRVTVTHSEVIVQYGLFGPKIPLSSVKAAKAVNYDWKYYGGFGIRRGMDGSWAYNMVGDAGRAVRIEWTNAKGKPEVTLVASPNPEGLARAIQSARSGSTVSQGARLRVAPDINMDEFEAQAEAEAEAILAEEEKKKK
ncbi:MAG: hypothetical protein IPK82_40450 [Polyangiaceae bacterium]|nr:hypothetical protein [Polyangiaceae bacterium]